ncbi:MAG: hypothetical protein CVV27_10790 [Candidatus Melainabacteria bacterium HGW-Melainabacteria-1]|nr:MAG: hypothetical protein CVV27_10790 [Candidatus Melainabacteria bacterium HGW-Melainabacteria-1]
MEVDADMLQRVFENLLANAIKFSPAGAPVKIVFSSRADELRAEVQDTGSGIPAELQDRIFDKFGQVETRKHSTGLGLTFCKLAIEAHGGSIGVESEVGKGSIFWFSLPLSETA